MTRPYLDTDLGNSDVANVRLRRKPDERLEAALHDLFNHIPYCGQHCLWELNELNKDWPCVQFCRLRLVLVRSIQAIGCVCYNSFTETINDSIS